MQPPKSPSRVVERFLEYVTFDTQSKEGVEEYPSTPGQLVLLKRLADDLRALGVKDVEMDEHGYVFATIPETSKKRDVPVIGFLAHVDTSPEMSGTDVRPIVHKDYRGGDIVLPDDRAIVLRPTDHPALAEQVGNGTKFFDVAAFGARYAYTMDGETRGEVEMESFSADALTVTFRGFNTHPGYAKGKMVNAIKVAADFIDRLPKDKLSPETTEGYEGYVHPYVVSASVEKTSVKLLIRDFSTPGLKDKESFLERLVAETVRDWPGASCETKVEESYRNMKEVLDQHPGAVEFAREAIRRSGLTLHERPIRGGTDGCRLSFMGLPTPNIFAGEHNFHSRLEWVSVQDMEKAVEVIVNLARVWEERS